MTTITTVLFCTLSLFVGVVLTELVYRSITQCAWEAQLTRPIPDCVTLTTA